MSCVKASGAKKCKCGKVISANALYCKACLDAAPPRPCGGVLEILNVQGGDVKIAFDKENIPDTIRAKRIVTDMIRRGYALVVEIERDGVKAYERVQRFDEARGEYIIADLDPVEADKADKEEEFGAAAPPEKQRERKTKRVPMESATATAVGRSAGG